MTYKILNSVLALGACAIFLGGCDKIGQTPAGGSDADVKAAFDKQPVDVRAKEMMGSPAPNDFKLKKIQDMYAKEGKPVPEEILKSLGSTPTGAPPASH